MGVVTWKILSARSKRASNLGWTHGDVFLFYRGLLHWDHTGRRHSSRSLQWRHNGSDGVSNHHPHIYLLNLLFRWRAKKTSKLRVTGLCAGNSSVAGEFPAQMVWKAENVCICWRHHGKPICLVHSIVWNRRGWSEIDLSYTGLETPFCDVTKDHQRHITDLINGHINLSDLIEFLCI